MCGDTLTHACDFRGTQSCDLTGVHQRMLWEERKGHFTAKVAINFRRGDSTVRAGLLDNPWADFREKSYRLHRSKAHFTNQTLNLKDTK